MAYCCSQCSFTAQFESALTMHRQLHHETAALTELPDLPTVIKEKSKTIPRESSPSSMYKRNGIKLPGRTSSATRLFGKLRAKICRSKTLFSHPEEPGDHSVNNDFTARSECTSKALNMESSLTSGLGPGLRDNPRELYGCHLCDFDADRITVLDRHLLNDHKIGLENLLKLVLVKTQNSLTDDASPDLFGIRQPYYKQAEVIEDGEFVIQTVTPKIKILKHTATNTDIQWTDIPDLKDNCRMITKELSKLMQYPNKEEKNDLLEKIQTLNECMCKFVDSSRTLKKVLSKELVGRSHKSCVNEETFFELGLENIESPRDWEKAHSEKLARNRQERHRGEKPKISAESYYF